MRSDHLKHDPFATTDWSLVRQLDGASRNSALADLCERYWIPIFAYVRRRSSSDDNALDTTQAFFAWLLEKDLFRRAAPERGRLRSFLLTTLRNFMVNQHVAQQRIKRGGRVVRIDLQNEKYQDVVAELACPGFSPEQCYERTWTNLMLQRVTSQIREEMEQSGQGERFGLLMPLLDGTQSEGGYRAAAEQLQITEAAARQAARRIRARFRELLVAEVLRTVVDPQDVEDEIRRLFRSLAPPLTPIAPTRVEK